MGEDLDGAKELNSIHLTHGTIVRWDKLKFVDESVNSEVFFRERVNNIYNHIGIYFHRFIESKFSCDNRKWCNSETMESNV